MRFDLFMDEASAEQNQEIFEQIVSSLGAAVAGALGHPLKDGVINIIIIGDEFALELNNSYRGKDYIPDVLSFPLDTTFGEDALLGEVYVCWSKVLVQAEEYGHSWQRECAWLMIHGILHLLGYDHGEEPSPEMRGVEELVLEGLNLRR